MSEYPGAGTMPDYAERDAPKVSGWAVGGIGFAASLLTLVGTFQIVAGLTAIFNDEFFVVARELHVRSGHDRVGLGPPDPRDPDRRRPASACSAGAPGRGSRRSSWRCSARSPSFMFIPYYPFWAITVIALDIWVIWALTRPGAIET